MFWKVSLNVINKPWQPCEIWATVFTPEKFGCISTELRRQKLLVLDKAWQTQNNSN